MIKAVIFDVGGVLVRTEDPVPRRRLEQRLDLAPGQAEQIVFNSEMGQKAQRGEITDAALWQWVGEHLALSDDGLAAFRRDFWGGDVLDDELIAFIRRLRPAYQTAVISNATDNLLPFLNKLGVADAFDLIVGSAAEGTMKPDPRIYERTLARLQRRPHEAVFIDDFAHNVAAARQLGMHAVHFTLQTDVVAALRELGVSMDGRNT